MAIAAKIGLTGDRELRAALKSLQGNGTQAIVNAGLRAAANVTRRMIRALAPVSSVPKPSGKRLKNRIIVRRIKRLRSGETGAYAVKSFAPHAWLLNFGTKDRVQKKSGRKTGRSPATQYQTKGTKAAQGSAAAAFAAGARKALARKLAQGGR